MLAPVRSEGRSFFRVFAHHTLFLEDAWTEDIERCEEQFDAFSERQKLQTTFHGGSPITPAALVCQRDRGANASCERERRHLSRLRPAGRMAPETVLDPEAVRPAIRGRMPRLGTWYWPTLIILAHSPTFRRSDTYQPRTNLKLK